MYGNIDDISMKTYREDQETLKEIVKEMVDTLNDADTPFSMKTDLAIFLWDMSQKLAKAVEPTKEIARQTATPFLRDESEWVYNTNGGWIKVSRQRANYLINDVEPLRRVLGASFNSFVDTKYNLKRGALEKLKEDHDLYREVLSHLDVRESKPRVSLRSDDLNT